MLKVFGDLHPYVPFVYFLGNGRAAELRVAMLNFEKGGPRRASVVLENRRMIIERREERVPGVVDDRVGIAAVCLGIDALKSRRKLQRPSAIGIPGQIARNDGGMLLQRSVMQVVRRGTQQPVQCKRHADRGDGHSDHIEADYARGDGSEPEHRYLSSARR